MEKIRDIFTYLFGVKIIEHDDVLYIEDGRPTYSMLTTGPAALGFIIFTIYWSIFVGLSQGPWVLLGMGAVGMILAGMAARGNFREVYVFDKPRDTYTFTRQSLLKKNVTEGTLTQFRAVQVEEIHVRNGVVYSVSLLQQGPFLSGADTYTLRESPTIFPTLHVEARIASSISKFLKIDRLDALADDDELTTLDLSE